MRLVEVNPELAELWLGRIDMQRNLKKHQVRKYADDMKNGRWAQDITAIVFDTNGNLVNGQHRLNAVIQSNTTQRFYVLEGVAPQSIERMDQGISRTTADQLAIKGVKGAYGIQTIAKLVLQYELYPDRIWNSGELQPSKSAIVDRSMEDVALFESAVIQQYRLKIRGKAASSPFGAFWYLAMGGNYIDELPDYIDGLVTGADLRVGDPRLALRNYMLRENLAEWGVGQSHLIAHTKAWEAYILRQSMNTLRAPHRSIVENGKMPVVL